MLSRPIRGSHMNFETLNFEVFLTVQNIHGIWERKDYKAILIPLNPPLPYFSLMFLFDTPWTCQKTYGFITFSGGIEMEYWAKIGWKTNLWAGGPSIMMLIHSICMAFIGFGRFKNVDIVIKLIAAMDLNVRDIFLDRINFFVTGYYAENTLTAIWHTKTYATITLYM